MYTAFNCNQLEFDISLLNDNDVAFCFDYRENRVSLEREDLKEPWEKPVMRSGAMM